MFWAHCGTGNTGISCQVTKLRKVPKTLLDQNFPSENEMKMRWNSWQPVCPLRWHWCHNPDNNWCSNFLCIVFFDVGKLQNMIMSIFYFFGTKTQDVNGKVGGSGGYPLAKFDSSSDNNRSRQSSVSVIREDGAPKNAVEKFALFDRPIERFIGQYEPLGQIHLRCQPYRVFFVIFQKCSSSFVSDSWLHRPTALQRLDSFYLLLFGNPLLGGWLNCITNNRRE